MFLSMPKPHRRPSQGKKRLSCQCRPGSMARPKEHTVFAQSGKAPPYSVKRPGGETGTAITTAEFSRNGAQQTRYFFRPLPLLVVLRPTLRYIATFPTLCRHSVRFPGICILTATAFQARPVRGQEPQHHGIYLLLDGFCFTYRQTPF